ncbi:ATP synthase delta chain, chloroplastic-like [Prunus avium]|uniref:ATP synthase delta chain, chloroplastic-like n=1 Tax=Prunus avium TaxID=42229 RepID=A0A6P5TCQ4_PRUAV|nr:ATP synthase delta chain, chloroplastic-like [Prunus avium]
MRGKSVLLSSKILLCWIISRVNLHTLSFSFSSTFTPIPLKLSSSSALADVAKSNNTLKTFSFSSTFTPIPLKLSSSSALADVAKSNNTLKTTAGDVEKIGKFFDKPSVFDFFINPTIDLDKKRKALDEIAKSSTL